jgi:sugar phosphate isomerase/epimerase
MKDIQIFAFADEASANIDEQIVAMKKNGLDGLEIRNVDGTNISKITIEKAKEVRKKMDDAGLITWSMGSPIGKIDIEKDDFAAHLDELKHTLELADILGAKNLRMFSFFMPKDKNPDDYRNEVIDRLGKFVETAKGSGVALCHENEKGIYGDIAVRCLDILKNVPELVAVFDPANFVQCGQNTLEAWEMLKDYVKYFHVKDAFYDGSVVPAGCGEGNLKIIVPDYIKYGGFRFTMEPHLAVFDGLSNLEQEGNESLLATRYTFKSNEEAFDAACDAFKALL